MKLLSALTLLFFSLYGGCKQSEKIKPSQPFIVQNPNPYAASITAKELKSLLYTYASEEFKGRATGSSGQKKAVAFIKDNYITNDIPSPIGGSDYFQEIPEDYFKGRAEGSSENVIAFIEGCEKPEEVLIISAHLDHIGVTSKGEINYGADDDGSGTVSIIEIAEAFQLAKKEGHCPRRSIVFLHVTAEEIGLFGSKYYTEHPVFPLENTIANLNIDMIGRVDNTHKETPNYLYLIGSDRLSQDLHNVSDSINKATVNINLDYSFNKKNDPNRFYYRSDHYNFAKHNIPVIFYFNGVHDDYHKPSDTPDKINYDLLERRARLIFYTAWELVNRETRVQLNE
jgi:Zn-dependent M28 family amino/carboxypeptidase